MTAPDIQIRIASVLFWVVGVGFGVFTIPGALHLARQGTPMIVFGFPAYGGGWFERIGIKSNVALLMVFLLVCVGEVIAGWLLWGGRRSGAILGLALLPPGALFWLGFALPIPPILAAARTILLLTSWSKLRP